MIITDIDYQENMNELTPSGGRKSKGMSPFPYIFQSFFQSLSLYPASSASVINLGGTSIGNTAISMNIFMPVLIAMNGYSTSLFWGSYSRQGSSFFSGFPFGF
ncbi:hypothetical protein OsccyDRAFT_1232 [Leptolyngbyaceae cyanobacterium JSC-12]|nr:hypothetical protein OsccyDRAFT_1232 [Leptolyngbyaceae cyanobacterium JSC-12]